MGGLPELWADYNTVDADGNPLDLSQRESYYYYIDRSTGEKVEKFNVKNYLTDEEAAQYTLKNVMGGEDNWQPDLMCEPCDKPVVKSNGTKLVWEAVPYAICYVVTKDGVVAGFTTGTSFDGYTEGETWQVQAVNEYGGLSAKADVNSSATNISESSIHGKSGIEAIYCINGTRTSSLQQKVNIVRMNDGNVKKFIGR